MFGEILRQLVAQTGKNQKEVAAEIGLSQQRFNYYATGKREPDIETLRKMSNYFGVSVDYLTGNADPTVLDITEYPAIAKYRALDEQGREAADKLLDELMEKQKNTPTAYSDERIEAVLQNSEEMRQLFQTMSQLKTESIKEIIRFVKFQHSLQESSDE